MRASVKAFSAVPSMQQERFVALHLSELVTKPFDLKECIVVLLRLGVVVRTSPGVTSGGKVLILSSTLTHGIRNTIVQTYSSTYLSSFSLSG